MDYYDIIFNCNIILNSFKKKFNKCSFDKTVLFVVNSHLKTCPMSASVKEYR